MARRRDMAEIVSHMLGARYSLGSWGVRGYDCVSFLVCVYWRLGVHLPIGRAGLSPSTYVSTYLSDRGAFRRRMLAWLLSTGEPVAEGYELPGDLAVYQSQRGSGALVHLGGGRLLGLDPGAGVQVVPRSALGEFLGARRLA